MMTGATSVLVAHSLTIQESAFASHSCEGFVEHGIVDDSNNRFAIDGCTDANTTHWYAVAEVVGAINRVDKPVLKEMKRDEFVGRMH